VAAELGSRGVPHPEAVGIALLPEVGLGIHRFGRATELINNGVFIKVVCRCLGRLRGDHLGPRLLATKVADT
jgi:hypothetical protein